MGWPEKEICIKCDTGGEVLACANSCCPIAVHRACMGCPARFDDLGKFYCPYCFCTQAFAESREAKQLVLAKKQALDAFIDKEMIDDEKEVPSIVDKQPCVRADEPLPEKENDVARSKHNDSFKINNCGHQLVVGHQIPPVPVVAFGSRPSDHTSFEGTSQGFRVLEIGKKVNAEYSQKVDEQSGRSIEDHQQGDCLSNLHVIEEEKMENELVEAKTKENCGGNTGELKQKGVYQSTVSSMKGDLPLQLHPKAKSRIETRDSTCRESEPDLTRFKYDKRDKKVRDEPMTADSPRMVTRTSTSVLEKTNAAGNLKQVIQPSTLLPLGFPNLKRKRVSWKAQEEEMLEEGVKIFSSTANKNIPWRKILEFGRHVFDGSRTPSDLKDKWRNICSKYDGQV